MIIALDYDGTITRDKAFWKEFICMAQNGGHEIVIITMRYEREPIDFDVPCEVYYTGHAAKKPWCEKCGVNIDVWIDDEPHWINKDWERNYKI